MFFVSTGPTKMLAGSKVEFKTARKQKEETQNVHERCINLVYNYTTYSFILQPPRIGGIKTYTHNVDRNEIIMDIDLM